MKGKLLDDLGPSDFYLSTVVVKILFEYMVQWWNLQIFSATGMFMLNMNLCSNVYVPLIIQGI